MFKSILKAR